MKIEEVFIRFRDDIKEWVTNNLNAIGKPKASDVTIDTPTGMSATNIQGAVNELNNNLGGLKISTAQVVLYKTDKVNTFQTGITYNDYCLVGLAWNFGQTISPHSTSIVGWSLHTDGTLTIEKTDISYGGENIIYVTVIHD